MRFVVLLAVFTCVIFADSAQAAQIMLSALDLSKAVQGWAIPHADSAVDGRPMSIAGTSFEHGFGTHAVGRLVIDLHGNSTLFHAQVGLDDGDGRNKGSVEFLIVGDHQQKWSSGIMKWGDAAKTVNLDLKEIHQLELRVASAGDNTDFDHADWADAYIEYQGDPPVTLDYTPNQPTISMTPSTRLFEAPHQESKILAATPPMGWNSYDGYGDNVTEAEMLANARAIARELKPFGWQYVVVDYRWYDPGAHDNNANGRANAVLTMDEYGRLLPSPNRFPSSANGAGFKPLADQIHAMGLKFGIHIMRGIPRQAVAQNCPIAGSEFHAADAANKESLCPWCPDMFGVRGETDAGAGYYRSLFKLYAQWGLDFVKVDDLSRPYSTNEVTTIRDAINNCGRPILFSTSPGPAPLDRAEHLKQHANMWRATDDFWDDWNQLSQAMDVCANWNGHGGPGHWPDMDMLPLGRLSIGHRSVGPERMTKFTHGEQLTLMTLWSLFPSPLMLGGDFTTADPWEIALLTNDEVIAINQDPLGQPAMRIANRHGLEVWERNLADGRIAVGLFNRTDDDQTITATWADLDLHGKWRVRDLWQRKDLGIATDHVEQIIPPHSAAIFALIHAD
jgi:alpha-galactosidase